MDINPSEIEKRILEFLLDYLKILGQSEGAGGDFSSGAKSIAREFNSELYGRDELREFKVDGKTTWVNSRELMKTVWESLNGRMKITTKTVPQRLSDIWPAFPLIFLQKGS